MGDCKVKEKAVARLKAVPLWVWYAVAGAVAIISYVPARAFMLAQDAWAYIIESNITLNFVLIFFIWGLLTDRISKDKGWDTNSRKSWGLFFVGLVGLILFFNLIGGYTARWDID